MLDQWKRLLEDFRASAAMEDDEAFLAELVAQVEARYPLLDALIRDRLLPLVRDEAAARGELPPDVERLFYKDDLIPLDELLDLSRKSLLVDAKMLLPFWYSVPILAGIARLLQRLSKGREDKAAARAKAAREAVEEAQAKKEPARARASLTSKERQGRVRGGGEPHRQGTPAPGLRPRRIPARARGALEHPAQSRGQEEPQLTMSTAWPGTTCAASCAPWAQAALTTERVKNLGSTLADSPTLLKIKNHQALELYLQLYLVKILGARVEAD